MPIYKSNGKLIYFAHIPKCAGTSVENYLEARLGKAAFLDRRFLAGGERWSKTSPQHIDAESLGRLFPSGFFDAIFAVVRHPADRLLSAFHFQRDVEKTIKLDAVFSSWLVELQDKLQGKSFSFDNHFRQQSEFIPEKCRVFRLEDGFKDVVKYLDEVLGDQGSQLEIGNFKSNVGGRKGARLGLTASDHEFIESMYRQDYIQFGYKRVAQEESAGAQVAAPSLQLDQPLVFTIKNPAPNMKRGKFWGETFFANGLANALRRKGHEANIQMRKRWTSDAGTDTNCIDIVLRRTGRPFIPHPSQKPLIWVLYGGQDLTDNEIETAGHIFISSNVAASNLANKIGLEKVSPLLQAFDADRMSPDGPTESSGVLYVGNHYAKTLRTSVQLALNYDVNIDLYGRGWVNTAADHLVKADFIDNTQLAAYYRGANVLLNDHEHNMGMMGFVSNRIFDALACGAPIVSDHISGLPEEMDEWVSIYLKEEEFPELVSSVANEDSSRRKQRADFARQMREMHSFDQRVDAIVDAARESQKSMLMAHGAEKATIRTGTLV